MERPGELPFRPDDLRAIGARTLIVHGDRDQFFPVSVPVAMYQAMPRARLCILPGCDHSGGTRDPELFARFALDFLGDYPLVG